MITNKDQKSFLIPKTMMLVALAIFVIYQLAYQLGRLVAYCQNMIESN